MTAERAFKFMVAALVGGVIVGGGLVYFARFDGPNPIVIATP